MIWILWLARMARDFMIDTHGTHGTHWHTWHAKNGTRIPPLSTNFEEEEWVRVIMVSDDFNWIKIGRTITHSTSLFHLLFYTELEIDLHIR